MKPVDQTKFGEPGGNCFSACVASLLHLGVDEVPYFMDADNWYQAFLDWLAPRGFHALSLAWEEKPHPQYVPRGYYILGGMSPRGSHAVIAFWNDVVHDPHPSREGLVSREDCTFILPLDHGEFTRSDPQ